MDITPAKEATQLFKPMSQAQKDVLASYLSDESAEIDQIHFLSGGNISQSEMTVVTYTNEDGKRFRNIDVFDSEGLTVGGLSRSVEVRA